MELLMEALGASRRGTRCSPLTRREGTVEESFESLLPAEKTLLHRQPWEVTRTDGRDEKCIQTERDQQFQRLFFSLSFRSDAQREEEELRDRQSPESKSVKRAPWSRGLCCVK